MDPLVTISLTPGATLLAALAVVAGPALFARGRDAWRLRRRLRRLRPVPLDPEVEGLVRVSGRVALEGPLFAPLSGRPCAGFALEVRGVRSLVGGVVREQRAFRLESDVASAYVAAEAGEWRLPESTRRVVEPEEALSERLGTLLQGCAEIRWLRERAVAIEIVERVLEAGATVSVLGHATIERVTEIGEVEDLAATGTDGAFVAPRLLAGPRPATPELRLEPGELLPRVRVDADPADRELELPSLLRAALVFVGPALSLAGLVYLARLAEPLLTRRP